MEDYNINIFREYVIMNSVLNIKFTFYTYNIVHSFPYFPYPT